MCTLHPVGRFIQQDFRRAGFASRIPVVETATRTAVRICSYESREILLVFNLLFYRSTRHAFSPTNPLSFRLLFNFHETNVSFYTAVYVFLCINFVIFREASADKLFQRRWIFHREVNMCVRFSYPAVSPR